MQSQVPRWRWWIHFLLIGGYFFPGLIQGLYFTPRYPLLRHGGQGLLIVCGLNLVIFTIVFLLGWLASRATTDELLLRWRPGVVVGAAGCRLFDRDSAWSGRDRFHRGPLSPDHAIGERGIVSQLCFAESSKDRSAHRRRRVTDESRLLLAVSNSGQLRYRGLTRGIVARGHAGGNAHPLAGRIYVPHRREHCHRLNRGRVWRCSFADGRSCRRRGRSDRHFPRHHLNHPPIDLAGG